MTMILNNQYSLGELNVGLAGAISVINPLCLQLDASLTGAFGLGPLQADFQARLDAALSVSISWNPALMLQGMADAMAALQAGLILPLPAVNASADLAADLQLKVGGIQILLDLGLALTVPSLAAVADIQAKLGLPGVGYFLYQGTGAAFIGELQTQVWPAYAGSGNVYVIGFILDPTLYAAVSGELFAGIPGVPPVTMFKVS